MRRRSGVMHTIEGVIAAVLLLTFVFSALPRFDQPPVAVPDQDATAQNVLRVLDTDGTLSAAIATGNLSQIEMAADPYFPASDIAVVLTRTNITTAQVSTSDSYTRNVSIANAVEDETVLHLWLRSATDPTVWVAGTEVYSASGSVAATYQRIDVTDVTDDGNNALNISVSDTSRIGYTLASRTTQRTRSPPDTGTVRSTSRWVAGTDEQLYPAEVTLLTWQ